MPASELSRQRRRDLEDMAAALLRSVEPPFTRGITGLLLNMTEPQVRAAEVKIAKVLVKWGASQQSPYPKHD